MKTLPKIAFYAPLKAPDHPVPSGDRMIARLLMRALTLAEFDVELASRMSSQESQGDEKRQARFAAMAERMADRLLRQWQKRRYRPDIWFTYHLYYKAPDWLGPLVAEQLRIPYVVAEASWANKRSRGPWVVTHSAVTRALRQAARIFVLNPADCAAVNELLGNSAPFADLPPFIDTERSPSHELSRRQLAGSWHLNEHLPWVATVAMMRHGDKLSSYQLLARAFAGVDRDCQVLLIGDGDARPEVEKVFGGDRRVRFLGALNHEDFFPLLKHALFHVWPAVNEAFGMALLEAQWSGLPVVSCDEGGVHNVMRDGETGRLLPARDVAALTSTINELLANQEIPLHWKHRCRPYVEQRHSLKAAAKILSGQLRSLL
jgi:glycosyltransferase involved in cell wall biosynthesis